MSLMICPDCGHECSTSATACPQCGRPFVRPTVAPKVIVKEVPVEKEFPKWIFVPIAILGAFVIFFLIVFLKGGEDETANRNINVRVATTPITQSTVNSSREVVTTSRGIAEILAKIGHSPCHLSSTHDFTTKKYIQCPTVAESGLNR